MGLSTSTMSQFLRQHLQDTGTPSDPYYVSDNLWYNTEIWKVWTLHALDELSGVETSRKILGKSLAKFWRYSRLEATSSRDRTEVLLGNLYFVTNIHPYYCPFLGAIQQKTPTGHLTRYEKLAENGSAVIKDFQSELISSPVNMLSHYERS